MVDLSTTRIFRLDPTAFERTTKRALHRRYAFLCTVLVVFAIGMELVAEHSGQTYLDGLPYTAPLIVVALAVGFYTGTRRTLVAQRPGWDSYVLTLGPSFVRRDMVGVPSLEILRVEVAQIDVAADRGITIRSSDPHRFVFVPQPLLGFDEVKERLADWKPMASKPVGMAASQPAIWAAWIAIIALLVTTMAVPDIRLAIVSAVLFYALLGWQAREITKVRTVSDAARKQVLKSLLWFATGPILRLGLHFLSGVDPTWPPGG